MAASTSASDKITTTSARLRSCVVCRSRKVRCDKLSPCSNCRRANIPCVVPSIDRPPRWARRLERAGNLGVPSNSANSTENVGSEVDPVIGRLQNLENLVKELRDQLEQANATSAHSNGDDLLELDSSETSYLNPDHNTDSHKDALSNVASTSEAQNKFGRLVLRDVNRSRYLSSGFWARMNDEIEGLQMEARGAVHESDVSSDEDELSEKTISTLEQERTPLERHGFLFKHNLNLSDSDLSKLRPLPSQIPFLLNVYSENIHIFMRIVDLPLLTQAIRDLRENKEKRLTPASEALMFSIYYATIMSMEEDEIITNFDCTKSELSFKYRLGLEHSLSKADFLTEPDMTLVQALVIFLFLVRRQESPRFVWMMTGLVIRMAQALGLHRDGSHFSKLTAYEVETRRRVWWAVCLLDLRASEDQGTELSTTGNSFDTKFPLNIDDGDLKPHTKDMPPVRHGVTDMTLTVISAEMCDAMRRLMVSSMGENPLTAETQICLLNDLYGSVDRHFLKFDVGGKNNASWCFSTLARMVVSKMNLILNLPVLFSSPSENQSENIRTKLLISAIEVAEYNHALNSKKECRHWRWLFQTCTHWHAIVYLLIEISRRQWSPIIERAWAALHSKWLIPLKFTNQTERDQNSRIWVPLRKLMTKTRKHRVAELQRLRENSCSTIQLEIDDAEIPLPASPVPSYDGERRNIFLERWRELVAKPPQIETEKLDIGAHTLTTADTVPIDWYNQSAMPDTMPFPWTEVDLSSGIFTEIDMNMDLDMDVNWYEWIESAQGMEH